MIWPALCRRSSETINKDGRMKEEKMQASVARCLRTPLALAKGTRLELKLSAAIKQQDVPPHNCHLQLYQSPITVEQYRVKDQSLRPCRSCFAPAIKQLLSALPLAVLWWRRRVPPPSPIGLLHCPFITIAGRAGAINIAYRRKIYKRRGQFIFLLFCRS